MLENPINRDVGNTGSSEPSASSGKDFIMSLKRGRRPLPNRTGKPGRPASIPKPQFTEQELEIAVRVMMYSKYVYDWVAGEARAFGIDMSSEDGRNLFNKRAPEIARKLVL